MSVQSGLFFQFKFGSYIIGWEQILPHPFIGPMLILGQCPLSFLHDTIFLHFLLLLDISHNYNSRQHPLNKFVFFSKIIQVVQTWFFHLIFFHTKC